MAYITAQNECHKPTLYTNNRNVQRIREIVVWQHGT